jgi:hypothetical protein
MRRRTRKKSKRSGRILNRHKTPSNKEKVEKHNLNEMQSLRNAQCVAYPVQNTSFEGAFYELKNLLLVEAKAKDLKNFISVYYKVFQMSISNGRTPRTKHKIVKLIPFFDDFKVKSLFNKEKRRVIYIHITKCILFTYLNYYFNYYFPCPDLIYLNK